VKFFIGGEQLMLLKSRCPFIRFMPKNKYNIKCWELPDKDVHSFSNYDLSRKHRKCH